MARWFSEVAPVLKVVEEESESNAHAPAAAGGARCGAGGQTRLTGPAAGGLGGHHPAARAGSRTCPGGVGRIATGAGCRSGGRRYRDRPWPVGHRVARGRLSGVRDQPTVGSALPERHSTSGPRAAPATLTCWPGLFASIVITTVQSRGTATWLTQSSCWPGRIRARCGNGLVRPASRWGHDRGAQRSQHPPPVLASSGRTAQSASARPVHPRTRRSVPPPAPPSGHRRGGGCPRCTDGRWCGGQLSCSTVRADRCPVTATLSRCVVAAARALPRTATAPIKKRRGAGSADWGWRRPRCCRGRSGRRHRRCRRR